MAVTGRVVVAEPASFRPSCYRSSNHLLHRQFGQPAAPHPRSPPLFPKHRNPPLPRLFLRPLARLSWVPLVFLRMLTRPLSVTV